MNRDLWAAPDESVPHHAIVRQSGNNDRRERCERCALNQVAGTPMTLLQVPSLALARFPERDLKLGNSPYRLSRILGRVRPALEKDQIASLTSSLLARAPWNGQRGQHGSVTCTVPDLAAQL